MCQYLLSAVLDITSIFQGLYQQGGLGDKIIKCFTPVLAASGAVGCILFNVAFPQRAYSCKVKFGPFGLAACAVDLGRFNI